MRAFSRLARLAYSAEWAAAFAYRGHAASLRDPREKSDLRRIEDEEWLHRENLARMLGKLGERPSPWLGTVRPHRGHSLRTSWTLSIRLYPT